ncbi:MAG: nucleotide sugar dehydrogenase [Tepidisphaeraceae bacterium]|jgi:UDPglucose 6-dehydrogenase
MRVVVYGLWHLGCVTAACSAAGGHRVTGLQLDPKLIADLNQGQPPIQEPQLNELIRQTLSNGSLRFTDDPRSALRDAELLWITFDTPVNRNDQADVEFLRRQLNDISEFIAPGALVLISSQVPVGFTASLEKQWKSRGIRLAYSPENLRLGKAIEAFQKPQRVIVGRRGAADEAPLAELFAPFSNNIQWMSIESAEMAKHALNAFLALSITFINEVARICENVGANAKEVERALKSEPRIGPKAYLGPGAAFAGGTLARDVRFLTDFGQRLGVNTSLLGAILVSNDAHKQWLIDRADGFLRDIKNPVAAVLGLVYKAGTDTLRRSAAVELCLELYRRGVQIRACDPSLEKLPDELGRSIQLFPTAAQALAGADVAIIATDWPQFLSLRGDDFLTAMRHPRVIDPNWILAQSLVDDDRLTYIAAGAAARESGTT